MPCAQLHSLEVRKVMLLLRSISTVNFYTGSPPLDFIEQRTNDILDKNPWLTGFLQQTNGGINLIYDENFRNKSMGKKFFLAGRDDSLDEEMDYSDMTDRLGRYLVKSGRACIKQRKNPLFLVSVVIVSTKKFALIVSVSHVIADGHTYYELYSMLSHKRSPYSMVVNRMMDFEKRVDSFVNGNDTDRYLHSPGIILKALGSLLFAPPKHFQFYSLNLKWIQDEKKKFTKETSDTQNFTSENKNRVIEIESAEAVTLSTPRNCHPATRESMDVTFISTNDILTSWFFKLCKTDVGQMAFNFRNRIPDLPNSFAGNYEAMVAYQPSDFASPQHIRRSIPVARRQISGAFPDFFRTVFSYLNVTLISNWSSFYCDVVLEGARQVIHLPILRSKLPMKDVGIIFRPNKNSLALFVMGRSCSEQTLLAQPVISGKLLQLQPPTPMPAGRESVGSNAAKSTKFFEVKQPSTKVFPMG